MTERAGSFVLAVRRDARHRIPEDWQLRIRELPGISAVGSFSPTRLQLRAEPEALARIHSEFGEFLHIEATSERLPTA